jgi:hypothetical protein
MRGIASEALHHVNILDGEKLDTDELTKQGYQQYNWHRFGIDRIVLGRSRFV